MKGVELYGRVRHAVQIEGLSRREAAHRFGIDPRTVAKMMVVNSRAIVGREKGVTVGSDLTPLHLAKHLSDPPKFRRAEESLTLLLGVFLDVLPRIGAL